MTKDHPSKADKERIRAMIGRMMQSYDVDKNELSKILNCKVNTINNWAHYAREPYEQLVQCRKETGVSMDWLLDGEKVPTPTPTLEASDVEGLLGIMKGVIDGALDYETITFQYPDAGEKMLRKLKKDLEKWSDIKTTAPSNSTDK